MSALPAMSVLRLATRGSLLARAQTELASQALGRTAGLDCTALVIETSGDRLQTTPVEQLSGVGWFTTELEAALLDGRADAAVHSAKDLPTDLGEGLAVAALLERADAREALVSPHGDLASLPRGATVGTSSPRRRVLLNAVRPDLHCVPVRGNVDTRLRKLDAGEFDALLLACAGLDRLGYADRISERLSLHDFVPSPAQGVVAIEVVASSAAATMVAAASDPGSTACVRAERSVLRHLGGGCLIPLGAYARLDGDTLILSAAIGSGADWFGPLRRAEESGPMDAAERIGAAVAGRLR